MRAYGGNSAHFEAVYNATPITRMVIPTLGSHLVPISSSVNLRLILGTAAARREANISLPKGTFAGEGGAAGAVGRAITPGMGGCAAWLAEACGTLVVWPAGTVGLAPAAAAFCARAA